MTILDANAPVTAPGVAAVATATIGIGQIDIASGGQGYDSAPIVTITDSGGVDRGASATATVAVKGSVTTITVTAPGAGYLTPGLKKFVDTLPGLGPEAANNYGEYIPVAVPDTTTYPGADYYEIRGRAVPPGVLQPTARIATTWIRATLDVGRAGSERAADQRQPRPDEARHADRRLHRRRQSALPRTDHRRQEGPSGPHPVPQPPTDGRRRQSLPAGRHDADGCRHGPGRRDARRQRRADGHGADRAAVLDGVRNPMCGQDAQADRLLHGEPRDAAPARRHHAMDQRRHPAPVDSAGRRTRPCTRRASASATCRRTCRMRRVRGGVRRSTTPTSRARGCCSTTTMRGASRASTSTRAKRPATS